MNLGDFYQKPKKQYPKYQTAKPKLKYVDYKIFPHRKRDTQTKSDKKGQIGKA